ncbi:hypothetical protein G3A43_07730 [Paraburkholderia aspalathi]|nr:hypothetical protein [Paraburkholderia aspalathi]MBK3780145.1 hypothetical protein [Paraburkholderia aspalathi]
MCTGLIVADVQPAYHAWCRTIARDVTKRINNTRKETTIVWVGEGITADTEDDVRDYLREMGARPGKLAACRFIQKGHGYFRSFMDEGVDHDTIIQVGAAMMRTNTHSSQLLDLPGLLGDTIDVDALPEGEAIHLPSFDARSLSGFDAFETCGGGREECLAEFELYLAMKGVPFIRLPHLVYG